MVRSVFVGHFGFFAELPAVCGAGAVLPVAAEREPGFQGALI